MRHLLQSEALKQFGSFTVCCIYMQDKDGEHRFNSNWRKSMEDMLKEAINTDGNAIVDHTPSMAVIINQCDYIQAGVVARLARNSLMREFPVAKPSLSVVHVDQGEFEADKLFTDICGNLTRNIQDKSSRIEVIRYAA